MNTLLILLVLCFLIGCVVLLARLRRQTQRAQELDAQIRQLGERLRQASAEIETLSKYRGIADADARAAAMLASAQSEWQKSQDAAAALMAKAQRDAEEKISALTQAAQQDREKAAEEAAAALSQARQQARNMSTEAKAALDTASLQAAKIVEEAKKRAEEIAGSAYEAMNNAALYEKAVRAMKNAIEGYGDEYLIPSHSILDDLAEEFGFAEAGEALKRARDVTRSMIRSGTAATCEYVEQNRRETAIAFVVDAFNGKVDSILSRVKSDNAGTLAQEIKDAFTLVNLNGKAFRDARITEQYLAARLEELKWAAAAQQLKLEEREEQRRIREQLREEEKARREYEKAIRDAAKEEDLLKKAMEKAQAQIEKASSEQRAKYEQQLAELTQKLKEAEERNQRALSMAQLTKRGHVYIISNIGSFGEHVYKIGLTRRLEPLDRVRELGDSSVPFEFDVHAMILSDDAPALEARLHRHFVLQQINKVNHRKEFFRANLVEIRQEIESLELETKWTMAAAAREYRESLAIERAIKDDPAAREAWVNRQLELDPVDVALDEV